MNEPKNASSFIYNKYVNCLVRVLAYLQRVPKFECLRGVFQKRKKRVASEIRWKWDEMKHEGRICTVDIYVCGSKTGITLEFRYNEGVVKEMRWVLKKRGRVKKKSFSKTAMEKGMKGRRYAWMDGWYIYIKRADGTRCCWWMYPRVSLAYHMLEILVVKMLDDDAGTLLDDAVGW